MSVPLITQVFNATSFPFVNPKKKDTALMNVWAMAWPGFSKIMVIRKPVGVHFMTEAFT
jgi:hypothetical protein